MAERNPILPVSDESIEQQREVLIVSGDAKLNAEPPINFPATSNRKSEGVAALQRSFGDARSKIVRSASSAYATIQRFADEQPLRFVMVVAGAAFVAGVTLRIWRSRHE